MNVQSKLGERVGCGEGEVKVAEWGWLSGDLDLVRGGAILEKFL